MLARFRLSSTGIVVVYAADKAGEQSDARASNRSGGGHPRATAQRATSILWKASKRVGSTRLLR